MNPLQQLTTFGQSISLDLLGRQLLSSGDLKRLIADDAVTAVTSNPAIFESSILKSDLYDSDLQTMARGGQSVQDIYTALTIKDVQDAADLLRPTYDQTHGADGFVSLEVSPHSALDTEATIREARELWKLLDRPNVYIKIPGTEPGLSAIQTAISEGININVTLLFSLDRYRAVTDAYLAGLEAHLAAGHKIGHISSVASFFLSRIDSVTDPLLEKIIAEGGEKAETAKALYGEVAIASAQQAYAIWQEVFSSERFQKLAAQGAQKQRLLWASTGTKNKAFSDVKYVEALIGPETVNTMPLETLEAYRDHGQPASRLTDGLADAQGKLDQLAGLGIDLTKITADLEAEGIEKFVTPFKKLFAALEEKRAAAIAA
jgi:transaldolase